MKYYFLSNIFIFNFLKDRGLIFSSKYRSYKISTLGKTFLELKQFEALSFLIALEVVISDKNGINYLDEEKLKNLVCIANNHNNFILRNYNRIDILRVFGLNKNSMINYNSNQADILTDYGIKILKYVLKNLKNYKELIFMLIESETFDINPVNELNIFTLNFENLVVIEEHNIKDIKKSFEEYKNGNYIIALRIIYPTLENILDCGLHLININDKFPGLRKKHERIEKEGLLSNKLSIGLEIFNGRNQILHGNINEDDLGIAQTLFKLVITFIHKIAIEMDKKIKTHKNYLEHSL